MSSIEEIQSGFCLKIMEGSHQQAVHDLTRTEISIGRATPENPYSPAFMTFPEPTLSRLHAVLIWDPEAKTYVAHHKSQTNPTLINGRHLTESVVLTPGDTLVLGRLVVVLDVAQSSGGRTEPLVAPPSTTLLVSSLTSDRSYSIPVDKPRIKLQFTDARTTAAIAPEENDAELKTIRITATGANDLSFSFESDGDAVTVETLKDQPDTVRTTELACGILSVPLRPGAQLQIEAADAIRHQDYEARLIQSAFQNFSDSTLEGKGDTIDSAPEKSTRSIGGVLSFLNGGWTGARLEVPESGLTAFELGPKSTSFKHTPPLAHSPTCQVTIQNGQALLRVTQVSDDQFVDINGDLFFTGESTTLFSGSRILLGDAEFLWSSPSLQSVYSRYEVVAPDGNHSISKQQVRLGTAAHCEVKLDIPALAPVVGLLKFSEDGPTYYHLNIAVPATVDGVETSAGLDTPVRSGSKLELAPGVTISIEEIK
jgi:pSer/pThr/pTyr-binding forkhead associated (FHA) protein